MTSEIAIMNREAIALAADSAITLGEGEKTWQTANKIFTLSKYHPVGIMIYGNASFMGVPWETIVKLYRKRIGRKSFDTIESCAKHFLEFLKSSKDIISPSAYEEYFVSTVGSYYEYMLSELEEEVDNTFESKSELKKEPQIVTTNEFLQLAFELIKKYHAGWTDSGFFEGFSNSDVKKTLRKHQGTIDELIKAVFEKLPLEAEPRYQLAEIAASIFYKEYSINQGMLSGVVIAGFGETELFPALQEFVVQGIIDGKLPCMKTRKTSINYETSAVVVPFAQREMVDIFMAGVHPDYQELIDSLLKKLVEEIPKAVLDIIPQLNRDDRRNVDKKLTKISAEVLQELQNQMDEYRQLNFINTVTSVVASLPKTELSQMAEALVSLTSLKRKVSMQLETVSGPIDVAVISKGDGFIWIKRKHYFGPDLNPQFFNKYFMEE